MFPTTLVPSPVPSQTGLIITVTAGAPVEIPIPSNEVSSYESQVAEYYGVSATDVTTQVKYSTTGTLTVDISDEVVEDDLRMVIESSIASVLDIHPSLITVDINSDTGVVTYVIEDDDFVTIANAEFELDGDAQLFEIKSQIEENILGVVVENISSSSDVRGEIIFTIDAEGATNDMTHAEYYTSELLSGYNVNVDEAFVSSAPSFTPSLIPTTSLPSASPSITGAVAMIELSKIVNDSLTTSDISDITRDVASAYGVAEDDIILEIIYRTSGTIQVNLTGDVMEEEISDALKEEIADVLGIHTSDVDIELSNGTVIYTVAATSAEKALEYSDILLSSNTSTAIINRIESNFPVSMNELAVDNEIIVDVVVTVDTTDASNPLDAAKSMVENMFSAEGYNATVESTFVIFFNTFFCCFEMYLSRRLQL